MTENVFAGEALLPAAADAARVFGTSAAVTDRQLLEAVGVAVYTTDNDGRITYFNEAAAQLWGRRPAMGEKWCGSWRLFRLDGSPMAHEECPMAVSIRENRSVRGVEAIAERPDGTRVTFQPFPTPLRDEWGALIGAINVMVDVTERTRAEQALRVSNAVKDEFLGLISHEMRTPVTTILGNAKLLRDRADRLAEEDRRMMVDDIGNEAERLTSIIENLLMLTRLESGVQAEFEPQVLAHVVRTSIANYSGRHLERTITLTSEPRHIIVEADRAYLEMLLENLISNADKYSPPDATIEVVIRGAETHAEVLVLDRGIGLPAGGQADIFAPFYRADEARNRAAGVGIGLSVCRRLAEALGGRVWGVPREGGGSEFGFSVPLAAEPA
ncbi:MAG TPA: ATP-binding protein [Candidatus Limnocylindrales bacterium]|nr:ATP-binding protein [Candidatus Limnocylindrales bacterium]